MSKWYWPIRSARAWRRWRGTGRTRRDDAAWLVEGIGQHEAPAVCDLSLVNHAYSVSDAESVYTAQALLRQEGILAGTSSGPGGSCPAALPAQSKPKTSCTFICDSGDKYLLQTL